MEGEADGRPLHRMLNQAGEAWVLHHFEVGAQKLRTQESRPRASTGFDGSELSLVQVSEARWREPRDAGNVRDVS